LDISIHTVEQENIGTPEDAEELDQAFGDGLTEVDLCSGDRHILPDEISRLRGGNDIKDEGLCGE